MTMPLYEYSCGEHGPVELWRPMSAVEVAMNCPQCGQPLRRVWSMPAIKVVAHEQLRYGSGSPGRVLTRKETGGLDIFIPSDGAMEQAEVDYIAEGAIEKEQARVKKAKRQGPQRENQAIVAAFKDLALATPRGQRARVLREAAKDSGIRVRNNKGR